MREKRNKIIAYAALSIIAVVFLLPLCWVVLASVDATANLSVKAPDFTLENYKSVLTNKSNYLSFLNGFIISFGQSVLVVLLAGLAAYPLSRYEMKYKKLFMLSMLFMTSLPIATIMVPVYKMFLTVKLYDNLFGVILFMTASSMPYSIWMMKNFMDAVPMELEEAAWVDGAGKLKGIQKVIVPLMVPGIFTIAIYTFSGSWGNFLVPFILISSSEKYPAAVTLYQFFGTHTVSYGLLASFSIIYALPSIILYVLTQRYMSKGFSMQGGTKG